MLCSKRRVYSEHELNDFNSNLPKRWAPFCVQVGLLDLGGFKGLELLVIKCWTSRHVRLGLKIVQKNVWRSLFCRKIMCMSMTTGSQSSKINDYRTGCRNVSHSQQQQVSSPIQDYVHPDDHTQPTYILLCLKCQSNNARGHCSSSRSSGKSLSTVRCSFCCNLHLIVSYNTRNV